MNKVLLAFGTILVLSHPASADMPDCISGACIGRPFTDRAGFIIEDEDKCSGKRIYKKEANGIALRVSVNIGAPINKIATGNVYSLDRRIVFPENMSIDDAATDFRMKYGIPDKEEIWKSRTGINMHYGKRSILIKNVEIRSLGKEISSTELIELANASIDIMDRKSSCRAKETIPD